MTLADLAFIERKENVVLLGPSGTGKTHIAIALGYLAIQRNRFMTAADILLLLETAQRQAAVRFAWHRSMISRRLIARCCFYQ